nr:antimicrobial peptide ABC transporter ATP-binding protein [Klebsiella pneumoniae]
MPRSSERIGQQLIQSIPGWTYKGRWWQRLAGASAGPSSCCTASALKITKMPCAASLSADRGRVPEGDDRHRPANQPRLLIADEPTNAMEPTTRRRLFAC